MELLKKTMVAMGIMASFSVYSQTSQAQQAAFSRSYEYEYVYKYDSASVVLQSVYTETSYEMNLRLGWLHYLSGKYAKSVIYYRKAMALMPAATQPIFGLIYPLSKQEQWVEVEKQYLTILKLDPKNATANYQLGLIYFYRKEYPSAKKYFDVSLNATPFDYDILIMSAWNNYYIGNIKDAYILFNKVLLAKPGDASAKEGLNLIK